MHRRAIINENYAVALWRSATRRVDWRAAAVTAAIQLVLFAALLSSIASVAALKSEAGNDGISVFTLAQASDPVPAIAQKVEALIVPPPVVRVKLTSLIAAVEPQFTPAAAVAQVQGEACDIASLVGNALVKSNDSLASIIAIDAAGPPVSRATMLWDGEWVPPATMLDTTPFSIVQQSVVRAITAASPECQAEPITGPQFIMLDGVNAGRTIVFVMGSGSWSWDQLLPSAEAEAQEFEGIWSSLSTDKTKDFGPAV